MRFHKLNRFMWRFPTYIISMWIYPSSQNLSEAAPVTMKFLCPWINLPVISLLSSDGKIYNQNYNTKAVHRIRTLDVVKEQKCDQNCFYNPESDEDIPLTYFEPEIRPPEPLTDPRAADLFWCRLD